MADSEIEELVDAETKKKYDKFSLEVVIQKNPDIFTCCPTPDCGYAFIWMEGLAT